MKRAIETIVAELHAAVLNRDANMVHNLLAEAGPDRPECSAITVMNNGKGLATVTATIECRTVEVDRVNPDCAMSLDRWLNAAAPDPAGAGTMEEMIRSRWLNTGPSDAGGITADTVQQMIHSLDRRGDGPKLDRLAAKIAADVAYWSKAQRIPWLAQDADREDPWIDRKTNHASVDALLQGAGRASVMAAANPRLERALARWLETRRFLDDYDWGRSTSGQPQQEGQAPTGAKLVRERLEYLSDALRKHIEAGTSEWRNRIQDGCRSDDEESRFGSWNDVLTAAAAGGNPDLVAMCARAGIGTVTMTAVLPLEERAELTVRFSDGTPEVVLRLDADEALARTSEPVTGDAARGLQTIVRQAGPMQTRIRNLCESEHTSVIVDGPDQAQPLLIGQGQEEPTEILEARSALSFSVDRPEPDDGHDAAARTAESRTLSLGEMFQEIAKAIRQGDRRRMRGLLRDLDGCPSPVIEIGEGRVPGRMAVKLTTDPVRHPIWRLNASDESPLSEEIPVTVSEALIIARQTGAPIDRDAVQAAVTRLEQTGAVDEAALVWACLKVDRGLLSADADDDAGKPLQFVRYTQFKLDQPAGEDAQTTTEKPATDAPAATPAASEDGNAKQATIPNTKATGTETPTEQKTATPAAEQKPADTDAPRAETAGAGEPKGGPPATAPGTADANKPDQPGGQPGGWQKEQPGHSPAQTPTTEGRQPAATTPAGERAGNAGDRQGEEPKPAPQEQPATQQTPAGGQTGATPTATPEQPAPGARQEQEPGQAKPKTPPGWMYHYVTDRNAPPDASRDHLSHPDRAYLSVNRAEAAKKDDQERNPGRDLVTASRQDLPPWTREVEASDGTVIPPEAVPDPHDEVYTTPNADPTRPGALPPDARFKRWYRVPARLREQYPRHPISNLPAGEFTTDRTLTPEERGRHRVQLVHNAARPLR